MAGVYKKYLLHGGPVPRSTIYYREKRGRSKQVQRRVGRPSVEQTSNPASEEFPGQSENRGAVPALAVLEGPGHLEQADRVAAGTLALDQGNGIVAGESVDRPLQNTDEESEPRNSPCHSSDNPNYLPNSLEDESTNHNSPCHLPMDEDCSPYHSEDESSLHGPRLNSSSSSSHECSSSDDESFPSAVTCQVPPPGGIGNNFAEIFNSSPSPNDSLKDKLCKCTDTTVGDLIFMTLTLGLRHKLTWEAQVDILKMVESALGSEKIPSSKYLYLKHLGAETENISYQIFCDVCESYLGVKKPTEEEKHCAKCISDVKVSEASNFFISISIESQLQKFVQDKYFVSNVLNYRFNRRTSPGVYSDIYDGSVYKGLSQNGGILASPYNFSYSFFIDGVAYGAASTKSLWPIYLTVNELPYKDRSKYLILAGLFVGPKEPNHELFLKPFVEDANKLSTEGLSWVHNGGKVKSIVIPLCCIADSGARYHLMNFQSFAARFGCTFCYKEPERTVKGQRYLVSDPAELRTEESYRVDMKEVIKLRFDTTAAKRCYRGVKGPTPLMLMYYFLVTVYFVVDYMHAVLIGVMKHHMELLLDCRFKKCWEGMEDERIGVEHIINSIDSRIRDIQSNTSIIGKLSPLKDFAKWKASELRTWLLFYSIPCLTGLLKEKYLLHLAMLSKATHLLLNSSVTHSDIAEAHKLYMSYTVLFQKYFKEENMRYNVQLLSHISEGVLKCGPIWSHNSFSYEGQNRHLLDLCKSPNQLPLQITRKFLIYKSVPLLCFKLVNTNRTLTFTEKILHYKRLKKIVRARDGTELVGNGTHHSLNPEEMSSVLSELHPPPNLSYCLSHKRAIIKQRRFTTVDYSYEKKKNDSCFVTLDGRFFVIKHILSIPTAEALLIVREIIVSNRSKWKNRYVKVEHILRIESYGGIRCLKPDSVRCPCAIIVTPHGQYLSIIPYGCSID